MRPGDSLTVIAGKHGTTVAKLAKQNKLDPARPILIGMKLRLPAAVPPPLAAPPSSVRDMITRIASAHGVDPALARAVAWMESGFQPHVVSHAGALGVMQVTPATWDFVEDVLLGRNVPKTTEGNILVGVLFLRHLLREFRGDERLAVAAYYQGAKAVREIGLFDETRTYVAAISSPQGPRLRISQLVGEPRPRSGRNAAQVVETRAAERQEDRGVPFVDLDLGGRLEVPHVRDEDGVAAVGRRRAEQLPRRPHTCLVGAGRIVGREAGEERLALEVAERELRRLARSAVLARRDRGDGNLEVAEGAPEPACVLAAGVGEVPHAVAAADVRLVRVLLGHVGGGVPDVDDVAALAEVLDELEDGGPLVGGI